MLLFGVLESGSVDATVTDSRPIQSQAVEGGLKAHAAPFKRDQGDSGVKRGMRVPHALGNQRRRKRQYRVSERVRTELDCGGRLQKEEKKQKITLLSDSDEQAELNLKVKFSSYSLSVKGMYLLMPKVRLQVAGRSP